MNWESPTGTGRRAVAASPISRLPPRRRDRRPPRSPTSLHCAACGCGGCAVGGTLPPRRARGHCAGHAPAAAVRPSRGAPASAAPHVPAALPPARGRPPPGVPGPFSCLPSAAPLLFFLFHRHPASVEFPPPPAPPSPLRRAPSNPRRSVSIPAPWTVPSSRRCPSARAPRRGRPAAATRRSIPTAGGHGRRHGGCPRRAAPGTAPRSGRPAPRR